MASGCSLLELAWWEQPYGIKPNSLRTDLCVHDEKANRGNTLLLTRPDASVQCPSNSIPSPPTDTLLSSTPTSTTVSEFGKAEFTCKAGSFISDGNAKSQTFELPCKKGGSWPSSPSWKTCTVEYCTGFTGEDWFSDLDSEKRPFRVRVCNYVHYTYFLLGRNIWFSTRGRFNRQSWCGQVFKFCVWYNGSCVRKHRQICQSCVPNQRGSC